MPRTGKAQTVREACAADIAKFCSDAQDLPSRKQCMMAHRAELSPECRAARQAANQSAQGANGGAQNSTPSEPSANFTPTTTAALPVTPDSGLDTVSARIAGRSFPSVFAPWNVGPSGPADPATATPTERDARIANIARHDLYWNTWNSLGLRAAGDQPYIILSPQFSPESIQAALRRRAALLAVNPNLLILATPGYFAAQANWLPPNSPYWRGATKNNEWHNRRLDFTNPEFQDKVAALCGALVKTGVFDGCMLDLWNDQWDDKQDLARETSARLPLIQKIRAAAGEKAILIGNVNGQLPISTAAYLDGIYMEGLGASFFTEWHTAAANLIWAQSHLRKPAITALEGWYSCPSDCHNGDPGQIQQQGRSDLARMRFVTTLSLMFSNGYVLFSDPNDLPTPDHLHDWYPFWGKSLGKAAGPLANLDHPNLSGAYTRQYEKGEAVFNPPSNHSVTVNFPEWRRSAATNAVGRTFTVAPGDGDLFLKVSATPQ